MVVLNISVLFLSTVMPIPGEGIESTYKNSVDDVQIFLDTKHPSKFALVNLSQRPAKLKGKVRDQEKRRLTLQLPISTNSVMVCRQSVYTDIKNYGT